MKTLILIILILFTFSSCIEKDKERFDFINRIINDPDNIVDIIKSSKFYIANSNVPCLEKDNIRFLQNYFREKFNDTSYQIISDTIRNWITYPADNPQKRTINIVNEIMLKLNDNKLYLAFFKLDTTWILGYLADKEPIIQLLE